ncbi:MAG: hypothetical protein ABJ205_05570 [Erythrobacter sp.]|uniref:hypothetical protein n=1 Tax=Erythrobacter sp. TaxID=1042 RepID=UPI0032640A4C
MSKQLRDEIDQGKARIVDAPASAAPQNAARHQVEVDRNFEIPTAYYGITVGLYMAFLAVTFAGFGNPELVIPMVIFAVFIVGGFGVPAIWTRLKGNESRSLTMGKFAKDGIMTLTGRLAPRDAVIQMLILPVLIVMWGIATVIIAAVVS